MADGDLEVELKDDEPIKEPAAGGAALPAAGTPAKTDPPDAISADIADVQRRLDESEAKNRRLEGERNEALQRASRIENAAVGDRLSMVLGALDTIDANIESLENQAAEALSTGDFKGAAKLNSQIAQQAAQRPDLLRGKAALEHEAKNPRSAQPQPGQLSDSQKIELYVSTMEPRAAAWIRAHPQYVTDQKLNDKLLARHYSAKEAGHVEGTDGYFRFIEDGLSLPQGNGHAAPPPLPAAAADGAPDPLSAAGASVRKRDDVQPPAAAPSRGGGGSRKITLTPAQQEAARVSGMTYEEYGKAMETERRAGTIGKGQVH